MTTENERERKAMAITATDVMDSVPGVWTGADVNLFHEMWPNLTMTHMRIMGRVCMARGLNPAIGDVFPVLYGKGTVKEKLVLIESMDSMRKRGQATGRVAEMKGPEFCGPDKIWTDVWLDDEPPVAARYGIRAHGMSQMAWHVRLWKEVTKLGKAGDEFWKPAAQGGMPVNQLGNAAERHAWRRTVPHIFSDMHAPEDTPRDPSVSVHELPTGVDPASTAGDVVADEDGVIVDEFPAEEFDAPDVAGILTTLWNLMREADPPYEWQALEDITGWPPGADKADGVLALLADASGSDEDLAESIFAILETVRI